MSVRALLLSLLLTSTGAAAQDTYTWPFGSFIKLHESDVGDAEYGVTFFNGWGHASEDLKFDLELDGFTVTVITRVGRGETPDHFEVIAPTGFYAYPEFIDVPEDEQATILIFPILLG